MSQTPQVTQPLEQTTELKQYHAPEFREYGTVQELTQTSLAPLGLRDNATAFQGYMTGTAN